jgi:DNA-binding MarR family transcriptional regulator
VALFADMREDWRRVASEKTGLPFGRLRALRQLSGAALTLSELAERMGTDAPSATVIVNDLERRGLAERQPHPTNKRAKLVSLTPEGKEVVARARREMEKMPAAFSAIAASDLAAFERVVEAITASRTATGARSKDAK